MKPSGEQRTAKIYCVLMLDACGPDKSGELLSREGKCRTVTDDSPTGCGEGTAPPCSFYFSPSLSLACLNCHGFEGGSVLCTVPAPTRTSIGTAALLSAHQMAEFSSKDKDLIYAHASQSTYILVLEDLLAIKFSSEIPKSQGT